MFIFFFAPAGSPLVTLKVQPQESSTFTRCPLSLSSESDSAAVHRSLKMSAGMREKQTKNRLDFKTIVEDNDKDGLQGYRKETWMHSLICTDKKNNNKKKEKCRRNKMQLLGIYHNDRISIRQESKQAGGTLGKWAPLN